MSQSSASVPVAPRTEGDPRAAVVADAVRAWRTSLVDLGGRNTLLWYRDLPSGTLDVTLAHPGGQSKLLVGVQTRLSDLFREPTALAEARRRARVIRAKTLELKEERGIAAGFLAVGMATWQVPGASRPPAAPVLLRSCVLKPTGAAHDDFILDLGADLEFNPVLEHYLRSEQGIEIDGDALAELATVTGRFDPAPAFSALTSQCARVPGFAIDRRYVIGTFSFAKLPMVADLAGQEQTLANHDVVAALAGDPGALAAIRSHLPEPIIDQDPGREYLVLDADSSQQAAIDAVRMGAHLVIKGPPGTGKSQTIANLVASLAADGKRVLFVAEKRAAIDAVLDRLDRIGLGGLVLDAYDGATNRRAVAQAFGSRLDELSGMPTAASDSAVQQVRDRRRTLVEHANAVHRVREPWGVSIYQAQAAMTRLATRDPAPTSHVRFHGDVLTGLTRSTVAELGRRLRDAAELGAWATDGDDPWFGARITDSDEAARAIEITGTLSRGRLDQLTGQLGAILEESRLPAAVCVEDWRRSLATMNGVHHTLEIFRPEVFDTPLTEVVAATATGAWRRENALNMGFWARLRAKRQAKALLRPGPPPADLHGALVDAQRLRSQWQDLAGAGSRPELSPRLDEANAAFDALATDLDWLDERVRDTRRGGGLTGIRLGELQHRLDQFASRPDRLAVLPTVTGVLDEFRAAGLTELLTDLAGRSVPPDDVEAEVEHAWWASIIQDVTVRDPAYGAHDGTTMTRAAGEFIAADRNHLAATVARVQAACAAQTRRVLADHPEQEALVRAEAGKARRHRPLRDLLPRAGAALTAIKPCWAMSPLVVASVLPPGEWFDVVVFDEASQIPPAQAVSAISRARQVVVAGDERQLPPTTFFTSALGDEAENTEVLTEGFESILDVLAAALPVRPLTWHYRSRDERLIAFANQAMYAGALVTFPGTAAASGVSLELVDGSAHVGPGHDTPIETTAAEVDRVVDLVLEHARTRPDESLGVIALGIKHAVRIDEALHAALAQHPELHAFFDEDRAERFFVKNLERVQGDERDAIILSIGFGKTPHGRVLHRFGPLNQDGGDRRLNVAMTRARTRMTVVSCLQASDLDPERLRSRGAVLLRDFLSYAAQGGSRGASITVLPPGFGERAGDAGDGTEPAADEPALQEQDDLSADGEAAAESPAVDSTPGEPAADQPTPSQEQVPVDHGGDPLVLDLARRLRREGLVVHERYGGAKHRIDLAVESPYDQGQVLVAVESDGPGYAAIPATRDRDRLRVEQLERLGWRHVRVWSTDLFRDPAREVSRIVAAARARTGRPT